MPVLMMFLAPSDTLQRSPDRYELRFQIPLRVQSHLLLLIRIHVGPTPNGRIHLRRLCRSFRSLKALERLALKISEDLFSTLNRVKIGHRFPCD